MVVFPIDVFLPDADLAPLKARRTEVYDGLVSWKSGATRAGASRMLSVEGVDYEDALVEANDLLIANHWGDGLPLWPATPKRVEWILRGSAFPRARVLGKFPPRGATVTPEACAVALAMAGGRPEYLPVLLAAIEAFLDPASDGDESQATSGSPFPVIIVNGPIGKQIRLNSGFGCFGPDPQRPAGASIGRALRLMQQNLGGALPGTGTMAVFGVMRYTNAVFAEDEDGLPEGWPPYGAERHGFARGSNSVSLAFATGAANILRQGAKKESGEEDAVQGLNRIAGYLRVPNMHYLYGYESGTPGILIISRVVAAALASLGWTKTSIREYLWEHSKIPMKEMRQAGGVAYMERWVGAALARESIKLDSWPIAAKPSHIGLAVAGGGHSSHALWLQARSRHVIGREIRLPEAFDELLAEGDAIRFASA